MRTNNSLLPLAAFCGLLLSGVAAARPTPGWGDRQRHARRLPGPAGQYSLSNVRWGFTPDARGIFRTTRIDPGQVVEARLVVQHFKPEWFASHAMLQFTFKTPFVTADGRRSRELVVSQEANIERPERNLHLKGVLWRFRPVFSVGTLQDFVARPTSGPWTRMSSYRLQLTPAQTRTLLCNTLDRATRDRGRERYHTLFNNCSINAVRLINSVLPWRRRIWRVDPRIILPTTTPAVLARKGVLDLSARRTIPAPPR
jgi:hypothetical protein